MKKAFFVMSAFFLLICIFVFAVWGIWSAVPYIQSARLCALIHSGKTEKALKLIDTMHDPNHQSAPLWMRKALNIVSEDIDIPLVAACEEGNSSVVGYLLKKGADPNRFLEGNWSPIEAAFARHTAARHEIAEMLISCGADVDASGSKRTALFLELDLWLYGPADARSAVSADCVRLLLENGAAVEDGNGISAAHYAAYAGETDILQYLLEKSPGLLDYKTPAGETPLFWAVKGGSVDSIEFLLESGANTEERDASGKTAEDYIPEGQKHTVGQIFVKHTAKSSE